MMWNAFYGASGSYTQSDIYDIMEAHGGQTDPSAFSVVLYNVSSVIGVPETYDYGSTYYGGRAGNFQGFADLIKSIDTNQPGAVFTYGNTFGMVHTFGVTRECNIVGCSPSVNYITVHMPGIGADHVFTETAMTTWWNDGYGEGLAWYPNGYSSRTNPLPGQSTIDLGTEAGGLEASWVMKDRLEREARSHSLTVGQTMAAVWSSLNTPLYVQVNTPSNMFQIPSQSGDVERYAWQWINDVTRLEPRNQVERLDELRGRSLLSFLDVGLLTNIYGLVHDYVWMGRETIDTRDLSAFGVGLSPSMRYALTAIGPELSVRSHVRKSASNGYVYYRRTERSLSGLASGGGVEYAQKIRNQFEPRIQLDFWRQPISGRGGRQEIALRFRPNGEQAASDRFFEIALAHKSGGYLEGQRSAITALRTRYAEPIAQNVNRWKSGAPNVLAFVTQVAGWPRNSPRAPVARSSRKRTSRRRGPLSKPACTRRAIAFTASSPDRR